MNLGMKKIYLIIGAPGSGKTSTANQIDIPEISHYSIGKMYRDISKVDDELGRNVKKYIDKGEIVPIDIAKDVIENFLNKGKQTIIIDGFPRSIEQAEMFDNIVKETFLFKGVIEIIVNKEVAFKRISKRKRGVDDNPELFDDRMSVYENDIKIIRDYYKQKQLYSSINGNLSLNEVVNNLKSKLTE